MNIRICIFLVGVFWGVTLEHVNAQVNPKPFVIPEVKEWKGGKGYFEPGEKSRIVCAVNDPEVIRIAQLFAADYKEMFGRQMEVVTSKGGAGDFILGLRADKKLGNEGYTLKVSDRVVVSAPKAIGVYWATRTLLQMGEQAQNRCIPKGYMRDFPDYAVRGFMIDCGRKFFPISFLRDYVKIMAYYKLNTFQIHLNDNGFKQFFENDWVKTYSAFRLESDTYPGLTARDGFYTKQEFIDLQKLAEKLFVEIIPEIDVPAHSLALTQYKPELGSKEYGMDHLDLFNPQTYHFLDALFKEYLDGSEPVFRGAKVHIGTDEYSNQKKDVVEKFRYFTDYYIRYVERFGKQACVWGALTHAAGDTPVKSENVIMNAWYNGYADPKIMAKEGYHLISIPDGLVYMVPLAGYYHDYLDTKYLYENWVPSKIGKVEFSKDDPALLGGMFAIWNDHVGNGISTKDVHHRVFPAIQTLAMKMWTGSELTFPYSEFDEQRQGISEAPGVNQAGRLKSQPGLVYEQAKVVPGSSMPYPEIGYNYRITFDIEGADEAMGTELFRSSNAVFYLSDPVRGMWGFARDGYLNTFNYKMKPGEKAAICIEGDSLSTRLYVDGKLIENMNIQTVYFNEGKDKMRYIRTLVFPLEKVGDFKSRINNLQIYQE